MTPAVLPAPFALSRTSDWLRPLLRWLAGRGEAMLPHDIEDWQLRDLGLTRPFAGPCRALFVWLP